MKLKRLFITLAIMIACSGSVWAEYVIVDGTNVRLRYQPSTDAPIYCDDNGKSVYPAKGEAMPYLGTEGDFYKVSYSGGEYYISRDYSHMTNDLPMPSKALVKKLEKQVIGKHLLSLQWISLEYFGEVNITKLGDNQYYCKGEQLSIEHPGNYLKLDGYIRIISAVHLLFTGTIKTKVYHLNGGEEYVRNGTFDFKSTKGRKYWREMEMKGPDGVTDYVDIYMKVMK